MKLSMVICGALTAAAIGASAMAQTAAPAPDPTKVKLAHELIEASGGETALRSRMTSIFASIQKMTANAMPADASALSNEMFKYMADGEMKAVPQLLNDTADVYAENLSEAELRSLLAWTTSPEGRSVQQKMPAITQEILLRQQPLMKQLMSGVMQRAADRACADNHCTPEQQKQLVAMMTQMVNGGAPAPAPTKQN